LKDFRIMNGNNLKSCYNSPEIPVGQMLEEVMGQ